MLYININEMFRSNDG